MFKNKLIIPKKNDLDSENKKNTTTFMKEVYINALKYYAEDPTADKENILPSSIFLYSLGDSYIYENLNKEKTEAAAKENNIKESVKKSVQSFAENLVCATQFRFKDRKFILDLNIYKSNIYKNIISLDFTTDDTLTKLILSSLKTDILLKEDDVNKRQISINEAVKDVTVSEIFTGIIDNVTFQEKLQDKASAEDSDQYSGEYIANGYIDFDLDGYFKASLKEWKKKHEEASKLKDFKVDVFPHIEITQLDNKKYLSILVATPYDQNFVDTKTLAEDKIFDCSFFIFEAPNEVLPDLDIFQRDLKSYLSTYMHECANYKLQTSMDGSIGEASDIARHWYSTGIGDLFQKNVLDTFVDDRDSTNFYVKFIEELLCKIDNISNTEIYPFDRVFIFPHTGIDDLKDGKIPKEEISEIMVVEAHVKSTDPLDQNGYISSWEALATDEMERCEKEGKEYNSTTDTSSRLIEDVDLNFSDKRVTKLKWKMDKKKVIIDKVDGIKHSPNHIDSNLLLGTLLLSRDLQSTLLNGDKNAEFNKLSRYLRQNRLNFDEMGIYYEYNHGISLAEEFPHLYDFQEEYFNKVAKDVMKDDVRKNEGEDLRDNLTVAHTKLRTKDISSHFRNEISNKVLIEKLRYEIKNKFKSKVVVVSFDPKSIQNKEEAKFVDVQKSAFTMVFVADVDFTKSVGELSSEIKDFKVLIQMVIRQIINHKANEKRIEEVQERVRGVLTSSLHDVKSFVSDDEKSKVDFVLQDALSKLVIHKEQENEIKRFTSYKDLFHSLLKHDKNSLAEQVTSYKLDSKTFEVQQNSTILPILNIEWDETFIPEAFNVMLKNSIEYASAYGKSRNTIGQVIISVHLDNFTKNEEYLIVTIVNNTPEIHKSRINDMNNEKEKIQKDANKDHSTGRGVVEARKQIQGINRNNNILFTMIDKNTISASLKIKIKKIEDKNLFIKEIKSSKVESIDSQDEFSGVLYFEDTLEHYKKSIDFMKKRDISFQHFTQKEEEPMKSAIILLTDMSILDSKGIPNIKEGIAAIEEFRAVNSINAPICILSNGSSEDIRRNICTKDTGISENVVHIVDKKSYKMTLEKGYIYIIENVKELQEKHIMILEYIELNTIVEKISDSMEIVQSDYTFESCQLLDSSDDYTSEFTTLFSNFKHTVEDNHFYIAEYDLEGKDLVVPLSKWSDFKATVAEEGKIERYISNTTYHQNTLLVVSNITLKDKKECLWLFNLGITNNIYFNFNNLSLNEILDTWHTIAIKRESSGYLSKLRHDIKNIKSQYQTMNTNLKLDKYFQTIIDISDILQGQLKMTIYESLDIYITFLKNKNKNQKKFNYEIIGDIEKNINKIIISIDDTLKILTLDKDNKDTHNISLFRQMVGLNTIACNPSEKV